MNGARGRGTGYLATDTPFGAAAQRARDPADVRVCVWLVEVATVPQHTYRLLLPRAGS